MQGQDLQDLVEGLNEWCNIPASVRQAFITFNHRIIQMGQHTHIIEGSLKSMALRQDKFNDITSSALDEMLVSFSNFSTFTHSKMSKFVDKDTFDKTTSEVVQNLAQVHAAVEAHNNNLASQLSMKVEASIFSQEIDRLDQAVTKKEYLAEEQRDTQYAHLISSLSQLDESCKLLSSDMFAMNTSIQGKVSKAAVATALKKRVSHEELDAAVHQIIEEVNGIVKKSMTESESKLKQITDKLASLEAQTCMCNTVSENSAPVVMLERQISKNFAEINKMVLDLDLKPDRTELQQLEESLESHFKLISGISQDLVEVRHALQQSNEDSGSLQHSLRQSMQHTEAAVEAQQLSVAKISKGLQELSRLLATKADKNDVEQSMAILVQMERQIKGVESKIVNLRSHDHNSLEAGAFVKGLNLQNFEELLKIIESKADREDLTRVSKMIVDIESSNHWHLEEEERRQAGMVRQVRSEIERHLRTEVDRCVRSEVELYFHTTIERKEAEWKEERQEELAVKANLTEVHQVRKETTELASRILTCSKELHDLQASIPRRLEAVLSSRDSSEASGVKEKSTLQLRVALDQLHDELSQVQVKLKKKLSRGDVQELLKSWHETNGDPPSPSKGKMIKSASSSPPSYVTKEELSYLLKQKVDFNELVNSLSLKMDKNDFYDIHETSSPSCSKNTKTHPKDWLAALHGKVDTKDFTELLELVHTKLDIAAFLLAKSDIDDNFRKLERHLRDLSHTLHLHHSSPHFLARSPPTSPPPTKKQPFFDHLISNPIPNSNSTVPTTSTRPQFITSFHTNSNHKPQLSSTSSPSHLPSSSIPSHTHTPTHYSSTHAHPPHPPSSGTTSEGGPKWFKDVKPTRYLEILQELNKGLNPADDSVP